MAEFSKAYFETEIREGFEVQSMMKRAWAGQIEVIEEIRKVCQRHNIKWFADYGTLLGAIRHKGFIPWDDDIDIGMKRDDLQNFIKYGKDELPEGYKILCMDLEPEYDSLIVRVVNSTSISNDAKRMEKYHGCPYVLGIDIFPLDYISRDKDECQFHLEVINIILGAIDAVTSSDITEQELDSYLVQVEQLTGVTIDRKVPVKLSLMRLAEKLCSIYGTDDADEVAGIWRLIWQENFHFPKEWFDDLIEVPFETVTIPVPKEYDRILKIKYGDNYMTPIKKITHDYPFYKTQEKIIQMYKK
ncbi:MAG: phosphorylcholine transferase LicD [Lachnospira pectinoschiza]